MVENMIECELKRANRYLFQTHDACMYRTRASQREKKTMTALFIKRRLLLLARQTYRNAQCVQTPH